MGVGVGVGVGVEVGVGVGEIEGIAEGLGVEMGVGDSVGEVIGVGVIPIDGVIDCFDTIFTATPLFHTNFFPLLMQVKVFPWKTCLMPDFAHGAPVLGVAALTTAIPDKKSAEITTVNNDFLARMIKG